MLEMWRLVLLLLHRVPMHLLEKNNRAIWDASQVVALFLAVVRVGLDRVHCRQFVAMA